MSIIPTARGIAANLAKELAPIEGAAAATGVSAGSKLGGGLTGGLKQALGALPTSSLGPVGGLLGAGLVAGFGAALIGIGKEFGAAKNQIIRETGQTGDALTGTFDTVKRVFADVPESIGAVTTAVDLLRQRGTPLGASLDALAKQELDLARITKTDLATNVEATTALFAKFGVSLKDQPAALDAIFKASQAGGKGIGELLDSLKTGGAALTQFGFGIAQSAALIASLERAGVNVQPALAGLRKAFATLAQSGQDPKKALTDLIDEFSNGTAPTKALADAMHLFGTRAGTELATAIQHGDFNIKELFKTITDGKGGILETADKTRTFGDNLAILKNKAELALQPLASAVWAQVRGTIIDLIPPTLQLGQSIGRFATELAPVAAVLGGALLLALKSVGPLMNAFASGLDVVASVLSLVPAPLIAAAGAAALLFIAFQRLQAAGGLTFLAASIGDLNPVVATIVVAATAITALGAVVNFFGGHARDQAKVTKEFGDALFGASSGADTLSGQVARLDTNLQKIVSTAFDAAKAGTQVRETLDTVGGGVQGVTSALTGSDTAFQGYVKTLLDAQGATAPFLSSQAGFVGTLNSQRQAFADNATQQIASLVSTKQLNQGQVDAAVASVTAKEGYVDLTAVLKILGGEVDAAAAAQTRSALQSPETAKTLGELAGAYAEGSLSVAEFAAALTAIDPAAAKVVAGDITTAISDQATALAQATPEAHKLAAEFAAGTINAGDYAGGLLGLKVTTDGLSTAMKDGITIQQDAAQALQDTKDKALLAGPAVGALNAQFLSGKIGAGQLEGGVFTLGVSLKGAQGDASGLASAIDGFAKSATSALPNAGKALDDFNNNIKSAFQSLGQAEQSSASAIDSAQKQVTSAQLSLGKAGNSAQASTSKSIETAQRALDAANLRATLSIRQLEAGNKATKTSIEKVQGSVTIAQNRLDALVAQGGSAGASSIQNAQATLAQANAGLAAAQSKGAADVRAAQLNLERAVNPQAFIDQLTKEAKAIGDFEKNLGTLVSEGLGNLAGSLASKGAEAGGALAQAFVNDHTKAVAADGAVQLVTTATDNFQKFASSPATAAAMGAAGQALADPFNQSFAARFSITHTTQDQLNAAKFIIAAAEPGLIGVAQGVARASVVAFEGQFGRLPTVAEVQSGAAAKALSNSATAHAAAGQVAGTAGATAYGAGLDLGAKTAGALGDAANAFFSPAQKQAASAAAVAGTDIGAIFDFAIAQGMTKPENVKFATDAAAGVGAAIESTIKQQLGIKSPSKVGLDIGENFVNSVALGLSRAGNLGTASKALTAKISDIKPSFRAVPVHAIEAVVSTGRTATTNPAAAPGGITIHQPITLRGERSVVQELAVENRKQALRLSGLRA